MDVSFGIAVLHTQRFVRLNSPHFSCALSPYSPFSFVLTELEERNQDQDVIKLVTRRDYDVKMDERASGQVAQVEEIADSDDETDQADDSPGKRKGRGGKGKPGKDGEAGQVDDEDEDELSIEEEFARHMAAQAKNKFKKGRARSETGDVIDQAISEGAAMTSAWW